MESRAIIVGLIVGILATVTMDVVAVIALRLGIAGRGARRTGPDLIGRWIGYLLQGKFRLGHRADAALARRTALGISRALFDRHRADTCLPWPIDCSARDADGPERHPLRNGHHGFPWFLMFPSQGMGWLGWDAPGDAHLARASLFNHITFGLGIALWMAVIRPI